MESPAVHTVSVNACNLRAGDMVAMCSASDAYAPGFHKVAVAEYSPRGGCIAFRIGFESPEGVHFMHTPEWTARGHYSWSAHFYATPEDAARINARTDLFHEAYPELTA